LNAGKQIISSTVHPEPSGILEENVTIVFGYDKVSLSFQVKSEAKIKSAYQINATPTGGNRIVAQIVSSYAINIPLIQHLYIFCFALVFQFALSH